MNRKGSTFLKLGTLLLFVFMAAFGYGMFSWATTNLSETRNNSLEQQSNAIECSTLEITKQGLRTFDNRVKLFFKINKDVERVDLNFEGEKNVTRTVRLVQNGRIQSSTANLSDFDNVVLKTPDCSRVFKFK